MVLLAAAFALALAGAPAARADGRCGTHPWCDTSLSPDARADLLLHVLTRDERIALLGGDDLTGVSGTGHTGTSFGVSRLGLPAVYFTDGPQGVRSGKATLLPSPLALAATFSPSLASAAGTVVGNEARHKGNDVVFAPTVNIMRTPLGGRTFEAYGEDPFLTTRMAVGWIEGAQGQGVIADVKHFAANQQEGSGGIPPLTGLSGSRFLVDVRVDERTLRETELPAFEAAVEEAHVGTVMCAYNRVNGAYACESDKLIHQILERDWGFQGFVLADYGAAHNPVASLRGGLDFEPWPAVAYGSLAVNVALAAGQATMAQVDEHVRRVLRTLFAYGFFDRGAYTDDEQFDRTAHATVARTIETSAITLMQNRGGLLPLDATKLHSLAVIGKPAAANPSRGGSAAVTPTAVTTPLAGIAQRAGAGVQVRYDPGSSLAAAANAARGADAALVFVTDGGGEGSDKACLHLTCDGSQPDHDALIQAVAAANPHTIVVLETGPVLTPWRDRVPAILEAWDPGQEGGAALARVLFGDADPGGRLPVTFPASVGDTLTAGADPQAYPGGLSVAYKEGVLVGYRWYDAKGIAPAFAFGSGLSYTKFHYSRLHVRRVRGGGVLARVGVDVRNTGRRPGSEVVQLYLGLPQPSPSIVQPPRQLRGMHRIELRPRHRIRLSFPIDARSLSYWDVASHSWRRAPGCYQVMVGHSSRDIRVAGAVAVAGAQCRGAVARIP
ncbi:MAG: glycosyl hydrolase [Solirubrobacterales bacterium]|nr:glycosyl hydrolase [Solirubrobacterales bacterium]